MPSGVAEEWTTGTIRRLFVGKGFGFIARDDLPNTSGRGDVFLHFSDLAAREKRLVETFNFYSVAQNQRPDPPQLAQQEVLGNAMFVVF